MVRVQEHLDAIRRTKEELRGIHSRRRTNDLKRHLNRLEKQYQEYLLYQRGNQ